VAGIFREAAAIMGIAKEFRDFILRGNVVDLAVGVIIGGAFGGIVTALVKDIITPFIGMFGKVDLSNLNTTINGAKFGFGDFLDVLVSFLIIALVVFSSSSNPSTTLMSLRKTETPVAPTTRECPYCLSSIPTRASRCAFCTAEVAAA
jgi:large conductance mechanosensitive channel